MGAVSLLVVERVSRLRSGMNERTKGRAGRGAGHRARVSSFIAVTVLPRNFVIYETALSYMLNRLNKVSHS